MQLQKIGNVIAIMMLMHLNFTLSTDFMYGTFSPYPAVPDKEKLKKEMEFAEECKKFFTPPKEVSYV